MIDDREEIPYIPPAYRKVMEQIIDDYESGKLRSGLRNQKRHRQWK